MRNRNFGECVALLLGRNGEHRSQLLRIALSLFAVVSSMAWSSGAWAQIQVNKTFTPSSVALGANSTVTVTLQNGSISTAAAISAFSDDIATMTGHAQLLALPAPTTTCGGTPTIAGQVLSMNNGSVPKAPSPSVPGSCTVTFTVQGSAVGNGFNTIAAANVVTSEGSPTQDVTQTLSVQNANITATATSPGSVQIGDTSTVTYVITNPTALPLTNVAFPLSANAASSFTISGFSTSCGGTATLPPAGTSGSANFSGLTIPANGTCTVTLDVTTPTVQTVNFTLPTGGITDDQGATNTNGVSAQAKFVNGKPNISKSFNPTAVAQGGTTTLTINVQNVLTDKPLTNAAFGDTLPGGLIVTSIAQNANCGGATLSGIGTGAVSFTGGTIATNATCTLTVGVSVPAGQATGSLTNTIPTTSFVSTEAIGSAAAATASLLVTGPGGGVSTAKSANPTSAGVNTPVLITLRFNSLVSGAFSAGTFTDNLPQTPVAMTVFSDATHLPATSGCGGGASVTAVGGGTSVSGSGLAIAAAGSCVVTFYVQFPNPTSVSRVDTNQLLAANVSFTGTDGPITPAGNVQVNVTEVPTLSVTNYVASNSGLKNQPLTVQATINDASGTTDTNAVAVINLTAGKVQLAANPNFTFTGCPAGVSAASITIASGGEQFTVALGTISATCTIGYDVIDEGGALGTFTPANSTYSGGLTGGAPVASTGQNNVTFATTTINVTKAFAPNQIQAGGNSTVSVTLSVPQAGTLARTEADGVAFSDVLPTNVVFSPTPNVVAGAGCQQAGQPAPAFSISGTTISFTDLSLLTVGTTQTNCTLQFDVTSSVVGAPLNQIGAGAITSTSGITNTQVAKASLTVSAGLGIQKTFVNPLLPLGSLDYVRLLITNSASTAALSGGTLVDAMPTSLILASTTLGPIRAGDPPLCGGAVTGPVGSSTFTLTGLAIAGSTGPATPGQCVVYVSVMTSPSAVQGPVVNTIATGALNIGGYSNQTPANGSVTITAPTPASITVAKTQTSPGATTPVQPGGSIVYTLTATNTGGTAGSHAFYEELPANTTFVSIAPIAAATTDCTSSSVSTPTSAVLCTITLANVPGAVGATPGVTSVTLTVTVNSPLSAGTTSLANVITDDTTTPPTDCDTTTATCTTPPTTCTPAGPHCVQTPVASADMQAAAPVSVNATIGTPVSVQTTCTNAGPDPATSATCAVTFPGGTPVGAQTLCSTPANPLAVGGTITCTTTFTPVSATPVTIVTTAASATPDPIASNNVATTLVNPGQIAPQPDSAVTPFNTPVTTNVIANDTVSGSTINPASVVPSPQSAHGGTVTCDVTGNCTYTPAIGFTGVDTYTYTVCDISVPPRCGSTTVTVTVGPKANNDTLTTPQDTPAPGNVSGNDVYPPGSTFSTATNPGHGTVTMNSDGSYTYTPAAGYNGTDSFTYTVCSPAPNQTLCSTATVTITIAPPNLVDPPFIGKSVTAVDAQTLAWTIVVDNNQNAAVQHTQIRDPLPAGTTFVAGQLSCQVFGSSTLSDCFYDTVNNRVVADVILTSDLGNANPATAPNRLVVTFQARFSGSPTAVVNTALACWDPHNSPTNITACTQSSAATANFTPGAQQPPVAAPLESRWMLTMLTLLLAALGGAFAARDKRR